MVSVGWRRALARRTGRAVLSVWFAITLSFALIRFLPGGVIPRTRQRIELKNPALPAESVSSRLADRLADLNVVLDAPVYEQYLVYLFSVLSGDLGYSRAYDSPVAELLVGPLFWSAFLLAFGVVVAAGFELVYARVQATLADRSLLLSGRNALGAFGVFPWYLFFVPLVVFAYWLELVPKAGSVDPTVSAWSVEFVLSALHHGILPASILAACILGLRGRTLGNAVADAARSTAARRARIRGVSAGRRYRRYVLPLAARSLRHQGLTIPVWYVGAAIVVEHVFVYPGLGWYIFQALDNRDAPLLFGCLLALWFLAIVANQVIGLAGDLLGVSVDARESTRSLAHLHR